MLPPAKATERQSFECLAIEGLPFLIEVIVKTRRGKLFCRAVPWNGSAP